MQRPITPSLKPGNLFLDVIRTKMTFSRFLWRLPQRVEKIGTMRYERIDDARCKT
jgi:hypothetical protein